jgi:hypothetical protein
MLISPTPKKWSEPSYVAARLTAIVHHSGSTKIISNRRKTDLGTLASRENNRIIAI